MKKKYLTFDELCQRWNCSKNELHYFVIEKIAHPSIVWLEALETCWWEPSSEDRCLYLVPKKTEDSKYQYTQRKNWVHLRDVKPKGASKYEFTYASKDLHQSIKEFSGEWYRFYTWHDGSYWSQSVDQDFIEKNGVFFLETVEIAENLDFDDMPPKLEIESPFTKEDDKNVDSKKFISDSHTNQLNPRTENNYLRLIMSLANGIKDFNPRKPYEAATLILNETGIDNISQQTLAGYITKANELYKKEKD